MEAADESRVLVIYTGGTIGMLVGQQGYVPEPYFLTETLRSQSRFHDPLQDSLFSHSGTVQRFRNWSRAGGRSESPQRNSGSATPMSDHLLPTLCVRSTRPIGHSSGLVPDSPLSKEHPRCTMVSENVYEAHLPSLVTPRSKTPGSSVSKSIRYAILEWNPLLDSSNMDMSDWIRIATEIELNYKTFDAFVILHGTDTMSYTSSALSFLLEDLGKTVIITGAQIPLSQLRNDATDNLMGALSIAGHYIIPECCLYFNHTLFRGNRVTKVSSNELNAFDSPNFVPLVKVGIDIVVNWNNVIRQTGMRRFKSHKHLSPYVATLRLFPGITGATISAFCAEPTRGVVLETFGAGNAPQRKDVIDALKKACDRGIIIVAISQCMKGAVSDAYETGRTLMQSGAVPGIDMTPECALSKLAYLLAKPELSLKEVRELMGIPLRGELTRSSSIAPSASRVTLDQNMENIQGVLSKFVQLSARPLNSAPRIPHINILSETGEPDPRQTAAPWSWTAAEAASTEAVLYPFLVHLAASKNDIEALKSCLGAAGAVESTLGPPATETPKYGLIAGGIVNCLESASGRSPLHVASLNGSTESARLLLQSGALVHLRDTLGHTALYYAARQQHESIVDALIQAGATLGGADRKFAQFLYSEAEGSPDVVALWKKCGV